MKRLLVLALLLASAANAAPWSTRWLVTSRKAEPAIYTIGLASSTQQTLPARVLGSFLKWRTPTASIFNAAALQPLAEVRIDFQPVAGAAANALTLRTTWTVVSTQWDASSNGYPFRVVLTPATQTDVDASSELTIQMNDATAWATLSAGTSVYVDLGACTGSCLTTL